MSAPGKIRLAHPNRRARKEYPESVSLGFVRRFRRAAFASQEGPPRASNPEQQLLGFPTASGAGVVVSSAICDTTKEPGFLGQQFLSEDPVSAGGLFRVVFQESSTNSAGASTRLLAREISVMTKLQIKGNWNEVKGKLKQKYAQLTDDDLTFAEGKEEELLGRLQQRLGKNKDEIRRAIEEA